MNICFRHEEIQFFTIEIFIYWVFRVLDNTLCTNGCTLLWQICYSGMGSSRGGAFLTFGLYWWIWIYVVLCGFETSQYHTYCYYIHNVVYWLYFVLNWRIIIDYIYHTPETVSNINQNITYIISQCGIYSNKVLELQIPDKFTHIRINFILEEVIVRNLNKLLPREFLDIRLLFNIINIILNLTFKMFKYKYT